MVKRRGSGNTLRMAVNNATTSLRSFGIEKPIIEVNEEKKEAYIAIDLRDLGKAIEKKLRKRLKKELPQGVELVAYVEDDMLGILIKEKRK